MNLRIKNENSDFIIIIFYVKKKKKKKTASAKRAHENLVSANGGKEELVKLCVFALILLFLIFDFFFLKNFDKNLILV